MSSTLLTNTKSLFETRVDLKKRLKKSLEHLLFEVSLKKNANKNIEDKINFIFQINKFPSAVVFSAHEAFLQSAIKNDIQEFDKAIEWFLALPLERCHQQHLEVIEFSKEKIGKPAEFFLRQSYLDDIGLTNDLVSPSMKSFIRTEKCITDALSVMAEFASEWVREFEFLVSQILLAENSDPTKNGFGGASVFSAFGSLLINPKSNKDTATVIMTLVHESSHSRLFLHHLNDPIILNDGDEMYNSPLRTQPRPMEGIFHAAWVSARMVAAANCILNNGFKGDTAIYLEKQMHQAKKILMDCVEPIEKNAKLSSFGKTLFMDAKKIISNG